MTLRTITVQVEIPGTPAEQPLPDSWLDDRDMEHDNKYAAIVNALYFVLAAGSTPYRIKVDDEADEGYLKNRLREITEDHYPY